MRSTRPYSSAAWSTHIVIALGVGLNLLERLTGGVGKNLVERGAGLANLARCDLDLGLLALGTAAGLMNHDDELGRQKRLPLAPLASSTAAMEAAMPTQMVETWGLM